MNSSRGIFEPQEGFAPAPPAKSPFAVADDGPATSPFAVVSEPESPFASLREENPPRLSPDPGRPVKLPERRPTAGDSLLVEARSPFAAEPAASPFDAPVSTTSPFATSAPASPATAPASTSSPFGFSQEPPPVPPAVPLQQTAAAVAPAPEPASTAIPASAAATPAAAPTVAAATSASAPSPVAEIESSYESDSRSIRQLELRAIFGVDRELGADEILQRARSLPGIRHVARIPAADNATVDSFKRVISGLGFGVGQVKLYCGSVPIEFIRENSVILAVQNDGSFAPGVRETLMIVARELGRL